MEVPENLAEPLENLENMAWPPGEKDRGSALWKKRDMEAHHPSQHRKQRVRFMNTEGNTSATLGDSKTPGTGSERKMKNRGLDPGLSKNIGHQTGILVGSKAVALCAHPSAIENPSPERELGAGTPAPAAKPDPALIGSRHFQTNDEQMILVGRPHSASAPASPASLSTKADESIYTFRKVDAEFLRNPVPQKELVDSASPKMNTAHFPEKCSDYTKFDSETESKESSASGQGPQAAASPSTAEMRAILQVQRDRDRERYQRWNSTAETPDMHLERQISIEESRSHSMREDQAQIYQDMLKHHIALRSKAEQDNNATVVAEENGSQKWFQEAGGLDTIRTVAHLPFQDTFKNPIFEDGNVEDKAEGKIQLSDSGESDIRFFGFTNGYTGFHAEQDKRSEASNEEVESCSVLDSETPSKDGDEEQDSYCTSQFPIPNSSSAVKPRASIHKVDRPITARENEWQGFKEEKASSLPTKIVVYGVIDEDSSSSPPRAASGSSTECSSISNRSSASRNYDRSKIPLASTVFENLLWEESACLDAEKSLEKMERGERSEEEEEDSHKTLPESLRPAEWCQRMVVADGSSSQMDADTSALSQSSGNSNNNNAQLVSGVRRRSDRRRSLTDQTQRPPVEKPHSSHRRTRSLEESSSELQGNWSNGISKSFEKIQFSMDELGSIFQLNTTSETLNEPSANDYPYSESQPPYKQCWFNQVETFSFLQLSSQSMTLYLSRSYSADNLNKTWRHFFFLSGRHW